MKELIERIIFNESLSDADKAILINKVVNASHGIDKFVNDGYYLHTTKNQNGDIDIQLWFRNVEENGETMHGPTNYTISQIIEFMKENCLEKSKKI